MSTTFSFSKQSKSPKSKEKMLTKQRSSLNFELETSISVAKNQTQLAFRKNAKINLKRLPITYSGGISPETKQ